MRFLLVEKKIIRVQNVANISLEGKQKWGMNFLDAVDTQSASLQNLVHRGIYG